MYYLVRSSEVWRSDIKHAIIEFSCESGISWLRKYICTQCNEVFKNCENPLDVEEFVRHICQIDSFEEISDPKYRSSQRINSSVYLKLLYWNTDSKLKSAA